MKGRSAENVTSRARTRVYAGSWTWVPRNTLPRLREVVARPASAIRTTSSRPSSTRRVRDEVHPAAEDARVADGDGVAGELRASSPSSVTVQRAGFQRQDRPQRAVEVDLAAERQPASRWRSPARRSRCPRRRCRGRRARRPRRRRPCAPRRAASTATAPSGSAGMPSLRAKSLPRPPGIDRRASRRVRAARRRPRPSARPRPSRRRSRRRRARSAGELAGVVHRASSARRGRRSAAGAQRGLDGGQPLGGPAAARVRVHDEADVTGPLRVASLCCAAHAPPAALSPARPLVVAGCGADDEKKAEATPAAAPRRPPRRRRGAAARRSRPPRPSPTAASSKPKTKLDPPEGLHRRRHDLLRRVHDRARRQARAEDRPRRFAALAEKGFFDGLTFHRIVPGFVIQGGDPTGDGQGGPGYTVVEAPPKDLAYTRGVVAMAKTGAEPAGTSGSQFFVVTGDERPAAGLRAARPGHRGAGRRRRDRRRPPTDPAPSAARAPWSSSPIEHVEAEAATRRALELEQRALARRPAAVGADAAGRGQHAVAGDDDRDGVGRARRPGRAGGAAGCRRGRRAPRSGSSSPRWTSRAQRLEHRAAERRAHEAQVVGEVEVARASPRGTPAALAATSRSSAVRAQDPRARRRRAASASDASSGSSSKPTRTMPRSPETTVAGRRSASGRACRARRRAPSRTASAASESSSGVGQGVMRSSGACGRRWRRAGARPRASSRAGRRWPRTRGRRRSAAAASSARGVGQAADQVLEAVDRPPGRRRRGRRGSATGDLAAARAVVVHGGVRGDAVQPRPQVRRRGAAAGRRAARAAARPAATSSASLGSVSRRACASSSSPWASTRIAKGGSTTGATRPGSFVSARERDVGPCPRRSSGLVHAAPVGRAERARRSLTGPRRPRGRLLAPAAEREHGQDDDDEQEAVEDRDAAVHAAQRQRDQLDDAPAERRAARRRAGSAAGRRRRGARRARGRPGRSGP